MENKLEADVVMLNTGVMFSSTSVSPIIQRVRPTLATELSVQLAAHITDALAKAKI